MQPPFGPPLIVPSRVRGSWSATRARKFNYLLNTDTLITQRTVVQRVSNREPAITSPLVGTKERDAGLHPPFPAQALETAAHCCSLFPIVYCACCLRAVNVIESAFYGLARHLSPCMLLKLRFFADSIPSALTIYNRINNLARKSFRLHLLRQSSNLESYLVSVSTLVCLFNELRRTSSPNFIPSRRKQPQF